MLYREFGQTGEQVSILGFGCMRLPVLDGRHEQIDEPLAAEMLHRAIDRGVNYVDTAYPYHGTHSGAGAGEPFVGRALRDGYRERVLLATKLPGWLVRDRADMDRFLAEQLDRLQTDHIDCYLLHSLNHGLWTGLLQAGVLGFLDAARADGRIRYAGFSFHDEVGAFAPIVDAYDWDFCQIQYNYMDTSYQAGREGLRYAAARGLGVVVMEPLKGGCLARVPPEVQEVFDQASAPRTPVEWALRFVWDDPGVSLLLSGMSAPEQVVANLAAAEEGLPGVITEDEAELYVQARVMYRSRAKADCTACRYCLPCPAGVDIPEVLAQLNAAVAYSDVEGARVDYQMGVSGKAALCSACGECEELCPQGLPIRELMRDTEELFGG